MSKRHSTMLNKINYEMRLLMFKQLKLMKTFTYNSNY
jgi:hypothetical protein